MESTQITIQKGPNDPDNHDVVVVHIQPDILECEVKWTIGNITVNKASGSDKISYKKILKTLLLKCCTQNARKLEKFSMVTGLER